LHLLYHFSAQRAALSGFAFYSGDITYFYGENAGRYWGLAGGIIGGVVGYQTAPRVFNALDNIGMGTKIAGSVVEDVGSKGWYNTDGSINYPPNNGAVPGTSETITLQPGGKLGRFGEVKSNSNYVTDAGVSPDKVALPPNTNPAQYYEYEIIKPIPNTIKSTVAEWPFASGTGGAPQYELPMPIEDLIRGGYIK